MPLKPKQLQFLDIVTQTFGPRKTINRQVIKELVERHNLPWPSWLTSNEDYRAGRGVFDLSRVSGYSPAAVKRSPAPAAVEAPAMEAPPAGPQVAVLSTAQAQAFQNINPAQTAQRLIPDRLESFVPWGHFKDIDSVIRSRLFYPIFITGLSGNGKTLGVEQACAKQRREMIRVNVTAETDEDDLLGGFRLIDGQTVFVNGPVIEAMERGAILLLDEVDLASHKIMALQPVLEGKGVYLKKVNRYVRPADGFNVIATANTKGKGNDDGRFVGTNVLNEAFLDRFPITFEQPYPTESIETKIVSKHLGAMDCLDTDAEDFVGKLVKWASTVRKAFEDDAVSEVISTRRLVMIVTAWTIFRDRLKAIQLNIARFDKDTAQAFLELYTKVDAQVDADSGKVAAADDGAAEPKRSAADDIPF